MKDCLADPASWFGYQGDDVAYLYRSYRLDEPTRPDPYLKGYAWAAGLS